MKSDRLVATLLFLQTKGTATAAEVAAELEVSERTSRRDLEALTVAGVPVYSRQGRGGGWSLVGGARTDLSGLTAPEARALFLVAGPSSAVSPDAKAALRKLVQALPEPFRADAEAAADVVIVDSSRWGASATNSEPPLLDDLQGAVLDQEMLRMEYTRPGDEPTVRVVHPLGMVVKRGVWYLIADTANGRRTFRVDRVSAIERTGERSTRPSDFDLDQAWRNISTDVATRWMGLSVAAKADPDMLRHLRNAFGASLSVMGSATGGWVDIELTVSGPREAAARLGGFGSAVQVTGPPEVIEELRAVGQQLLALYPPGQVGRGSDPSV